VKLVLLTGEDCGICEEAERRFKKDFWRELDTGEARIVNLDEDEEAQKLFVENELPLAPLVILMTDRGTVISHIETSDLFEGLKEACPVSAEAVKAAVESNGDNKSKKEG